MASVMLNHGLRTVPTEPNFVLSPLSALLALGPVVELKPNYRDELLRLYPGCENTEDLAKVIREVVKLPSRNCRFWGCVVADPARLNLSEENAKSLSKDFDIPVFAGGDLAQLAKEINRQVLEATVRKISLELTEKDLKHLLVVINVLTFRDDWVEQFSNELTATSEWHCRDGSVINCMFMEGTIECGYWSSDDFQCVNLKYNSGAQMSILLPRDPSGPHELRGNLLEDLLKAQKRGRLVHIKLPKWSLKVKEHRLEAILNDCFDTPLENLRVRQVTRIAVDEYGTKAEAVTICSDESGYSSDEEYSDVLEFIVDHPFFYAIWDDAGISFCGYIGAPEESE